MQTSLVPSSIYQKVSTEVELYTCLESKKMWNL